MIKGLEKLVKVAVKENSQTFLRYHQICIQVRTSLQSHVSNQVIIARSKYEKQDL